MFLFYLMTKIITVKVSKGGVGKTTVASNLSYVLSQKEYKVLMIDLDSQSNLSKSFLKEFDDNILTSSNFLGDDEINLSEMIYNINENLDLIISDIGLHEVAKFLENESEYYYRLKNITKAGHLKDYDFVVLDLSPGVGDVLTQISLVGSDLLICPTHFDIDSLTGIVHTINDVSRLDDAKLLDSELNYLVVPNRYDKRFKKDNDAIFNMLYENLDEEFIANPIRENSHIKKARMINTTAIEYENDDLRKYEHKRAIEDFEELSIKVIDILNIQ